MKTGAEGVYCAALPKLGLGIALKADDGAKRAAEALVMGVIAHLLPGARSLIPDPVLRNWRGTVVGEVRLAPAFRASLDSCVV
jgi:L-asparaginase II